jgi:hypothetical protein
MKFAFICELCQRDLKRSDKISLDMTEWESECVGSGGAVIDAMCRPCANKFYKKIKTMRKTSKRQR